jgi:NAD(P)-dependent dehydrogenase (short-subunit alcohol dehydrogenase family)
MSKGTAGLNLHPLKERVALISGATGASGRACALAFARQGAKLALVSSGLDKLEEMQRELVLPDESTLLFAADLREREAARYMVEAVLARYGRLDVLLHLVGGWIGGTPASKVPAADMRHMLDQHLWTTYYLAQAALPAMLEHNWGRLIVVSSPAAQRPAATAPAYAVGKAAQEAFIRAVSQEMKGRGVTANIIQVNAIAANGEAQPGQATPDEIAAAALYLCSDEGGKVNGGRLPLTGEQV